MKPIPAGLMGGDWMTWKVLKPFTSVQNRAEVFKTLSDFRWLFASFLLTFVTVAILLL